MLWCRLLQTSHFELCARDEAMLSNLNLNSLAMEYICDN